MEFFDLNVPFLEDPETAPAKKKKNTKDSRRKLVAKAIELGYSGIAYNKFIHGSLSGSDRSAIPLLPLSSLLETSPTLLSAAKFHRELLGVSLDSPFRQYTRITVAVDTLVHASAMNAGNPVLKTYDLIAVQPMNQVTFDQACKLSDSEVHMISIDLSKKLPFRLKFPMIKAAIKHGLYFEITYSPLVSDAGAIRDMLSSAKLLVQWTRGKNLIFSSAALTSIGLRGPSDVANLSTLLNLSRKRAEAAISTNCRSLIANALRKKQYYKGAIKIERIGTNDFLDIENASSHSMCSAWDSISSEGNLVLKEEKVVAPSPTIKRKLDSLLMSSFSLSCIQSQYPSSS